MCCEDLASDGGPLAAPSASMGLGAGGRMRQEVYADDRALADYDEGDARRVFVHLCSAAQWTAITGEVPPSTPVDRDAGLPWFDYYDVDARGLAPSTILSKVATVRKMTGTEEVPFVPVDPKTVIELGGHQPRWSPTARGSRDLDALGAVGHPGVGVVIGDHATTSPGSGT